MKDIELWQGDCLELMKDIPDASVDMILCDLPYGTTKAKWDTIIPFEPLWEQYERVIKDNGAIVLTATQPFTSALVMSKPKWFKHAWTWDKKTGKGHLVAKYRPLQQTEDILVFSRKGMRVNYYPIMVERDKAEKGYSVEASRSELLGGKTTKERKPVVRTHKYPKTILTFPNHTTKDSFHPTQKPVPLFEYLIKTYTNEGETVLDNCMGSGTTGVACKNLNRKFIGIELDETYFNLAKERIESVREKDE